MDPLAVTFLDSANEGGNSLMECWFGDFFISCSARDFNSWEQVKNHCDSVHPSWKCRGECEPKVPMSTKGSMQARMR